MTLEWIFATPRTQSAVAYVHVPYCQNHCLFCGFFQNVWRPEVSAAFVDDVVAEVARLADRPLVASAPVEAVYIGGGTPSALSGDDLARLVAGCVATFRSHSTVRSRLRAGSTISDWPRRLPPSMRAPTESHSVFSASIPTCGGGSDARQAAKR